MIESDWTTGRRRHCLFPFPQRGTVVSIDAVVAGADEVRGQAGESLGCGEMQRLLVAAEKHAESSELSMKSLLAASELPVGAPSLADPTKDRPNGRHPTGLDVVCTVALHDSLCLSSKMGLIKHVKDWTMATRQGTGTAAWALHLFHSRARKATPIGLPQLSDRDGSSPGSG